MSILLLSIVLSGAILLNGIVHPNPESVVTQPLSPLPPAHDRLIAVLVAVCILGGAVCAFAWQYNRAPDGYAQTVKGLASAQATLDEVMNRPADFSWPFPSVVTVASEQDLKDHRCEIAQALLTRLRTLEEGGPMEVRHNFENFYGEVLEGSAQADFQTPEALWILTYSPQLRENTALLFYKIPYDGSSEREVRDYGLDCTADAGYLEGNEIFDPADEDSYEENMFFSESEFLDDKPRGEHYRPYWQEELDHAYRVAAQAFGL